VKESIERRIMGGLALAILLVGMIALVAYRQTQSYMETVRRVAHTNEVLTSLMDVFSTMKDLEAAERGYIIAGTEDYLQPFTISIKIIAQKLEHLRNLTADNPHQQDRLDRLEPLIERKKAISTEQIEARRNGGLEAAVLLVHRDTGKLVMDGIRAIVEEMKEEENGLLEQRIAKEQEYARKTFLIFFVLSFAILALIIFVYSMFKRDLVRRQRTEEAMHKLNAKFETANKELEAFSYSVSHDLRAPLRHVNGFVELLKQHMGAQIDEKGQRYMETILKSARRMGTLIDDLLVFSKMAKSEMRIGKVHLDPLVQEVIKDSQSEVQGRKIAWKIGSLPEVDGDAAMLRQVWANLIENAVKYTRTRVKTEIEMGSRPEGKEWVFFVRDNGVGFDPQYADKLFGVFQRLHSSDEFEGTGIGLANVRRIIQRHGGRTWAEGRVDGGAVFYFSLPKRGRNRDE
jgi:signal transduction histidine kinase